MEWVSRMVEEMLKGAVYRSASEGAPEPPVRSAEAPEPSAWLKAVSDAENTLNRLLEERNDAVTYAARYMVHQRYWEWVDPKTVRVIELNAIDDSRRFELSGSMPNGTELTPVRWRVPHMVSAMNAGVEAVLEALDRAVNQLAAQAMAKF